MTVTLKPVFAGTIPTSQKPASVFTQTPQSDTVAFMPKPHRHHYRPGIIATLGPASSHPDTLRQMILAGATTLRFNFSHINNETQRQWAEEKVRDIAQLSRELNIPVSTFADMQGPKIRTGDLPGGKMELNDGQTVFLAEESKPMEAKPDSAPNQPLIPVTLPAIISAIAPGQVIKLDDGKLRLKAMEAAEGPEGHRRVRCEVTKGGTLTNRKGLNLPYVRIDVPALSEKDRQDIRRAFQMGIQNIAISFVQTPQDVKETRAYIQSLIPEFGDLARNAKIIAKIEKPDALEPHTLRKIVKAADMIMVARGDLAVEADIRDLPKLESQIIRESHIQGKPVIEATQFLESMMENDELANRPEVNDIADAARDGVQYLMLSGETSTGKYPVQAVQTMHDIIERYNEERSIPAAFNRLKEAFEVYGLHTYFWLKRKLRGAS